MDFEYTYTDDCIFKKHCPREQRVGCDIHCPIQPEFYYLWHTSNIPTQYLKTTRLYPDQQDLETFHTLKAIMEDIEVFVEEGRTLYLWSKTVGNAKTTWACKLLKAYLASICIGNGFQDRAFFEYMPSFVMLAKDFQNPEREKHLKALIERDLVVMDDVGSIKNTSYDNTMFLDIINARYSNNKATIYTSNAEPTALFSDNLRMTDRICSDIVLEFKGKGKRRSTNIYKRKGEKE